jgi:hypothetical protein
MALISCKECGAQISDAAPVCPRCSIAQPGLTKTGKLSISRKASTTGSLHFVQVVVDGKQVGEIRDGGNLTLDLAPGTHMIEVGGGGLSRRLEVSIVEGEVLRYQMYFNAWGILGGGLQLRPA